MAKKPIKVTEVVLRDAHQSLLATRMTMDEMRPILPEMDKINYFSVECWGGATFDSCIRFLDEDPWERLRTFGIDFNSSTVINGLPIICNDCDFSLPFDTEPDSTVCSPKDFDSTSAD